MGLLNTADEQVDKLLNFMLDDADVAWPEITLKFVLSFGGVHTAIVGITSTLNAQLNLEAARKHPSCENKSSKNSATRSSSPRSTTASRGPR